MISIDFEHASDTSMANVEPIQWGAAAARFSDGKMQPLGGQMLPLP